MKLKVLGFSAFLFFCFYGGTIFASAQHNSANKFSDINSAILALGQEYGASHVLIATDLDTTLLTPKVYIGSEPWFQWQTSMMGSSNPYLVSNDFNQILTYQNMIMKLVGMYPSEPDMVSDYATYQKAGYKLLVLTARGPNVRDITEENLSSNNLLNGFEQNSIATGFVGEYIPFDISKPENYGLTATELQDFNIKSNPRPVSFFNGIFTACGNNKGLMLQTLLNKTQDNDIKCIVFIDNTQKNDDDVYKAFSKYVPNVDIQTFTYGYENNWYNALLNDPQIQAQVYQKWVVFKQALDLINTAP